MDRPKIIKGSTSSQDNKSWFEYIWKEQQESPNRLEDEEKFF